MHVRLSLALLVLLAVGCTTEPKTVGDPSFPTRQTYNIKPQELLAKVKAAVTSPSIGLRIESENEGILTTSWESHEGKKYGLAGVGRVWQERTRYTVRVSPAWDDPANKCTIEVTEESQQRPHANWEWGSQDPITRPARAAELARKIDAALQASR